MFPIYQVIFFIFAAVLLVSAAMVVFSREPIRAVLFLVLAFFSSAVLWMMLQAEFLALVLIFVYVGAVMTLFLFVVMMLNLDMSKVCEKFVRYLPLGLVALILLVGLFAYVVTPNHLGSMADAHLGHVSADYSNTAAMGKLLFTNFLYPFEIAAMLLLVGMVSAITLVFNGRRKDAKSQDVAEQHRATKRDRLKIVSMGTDKS